MGWEWRRGALIDSRVACLCLAGGEGGGRAHRYSSGALVFGGWGGMEGERASGGVCSYGWGVVGERAQRYAGGVLGGWGVGEVEALIDMMVA